MVTYTISTEGVTLQHLRGFFVGWESRPDPETHLEILEGSDAVELAVDSQSGRVVGFATAVTDRVLSAYIPLLEVLPDYRGRGIGTELVRRMLSRLEGMRMVDVVCDDDLCRFYERFGMRRCHSMVIRR